MEMMAIVTGALIALWVIALLLAYLVWRGE